MKNGNKIWEFGNELNMSSPDIGGAGEGIGKALLAESYVKWLKAIRKIQSEKTEWQKIKLYLSVLPVLTKYSWKNSSH